MQEEEEKKNRNRNKIRGKFVHEERRGEKRENRRREEMKKRKVKDDNVCNALSLHGPEGFGSNSMPYFLS
jgi:hypothetical protein